MRVRHSTSLQGRSQLNSFRKRGEKLLDVSGQRKRSRMPYPRGTREGPLYHYPLQEKKGALNIFQEGLDIPADKGGKKKGEKRGLGQDSYFQTC